MNIGNYQRQLSEYMKYKRYSPESVRNYVSSIGKFLKHFEKEATKPSEISAEKIKVFLGEFKNPYTHKAYLCSIKLFYDKIGKQPRKLDDVEYPKTSQRLPIVLSQNEIQRMFDVCENLKHRVILSLLYACGLRVSELINLRWKDIDRENKVIHIIHGKGDKDRSVMLPDNIIAILEKYYREYKSKEYVLNGQFDVKYSKTSVLQVMKQLSSKAGIKKHVHTHLIRHCFATHMVENGIDINKIQILLGHSNVKTTMIYTHIGTNLISNIQSPINGIRI